MNSILKGFAALFLSGLLMVGPAIAKDKKGKAPIRTAPASYQNLKNPYTSASDLKAGKKIYEKKCAEDCHGDNGEGDGESATAFQDGAYMKEKSDGQLFFIAKEGNGPDGSMEAWGPGSDYALSEKKLWQAIAYIRTLAK